MRAGGWVGVGWDVAKKEGSQRNKKGRGKGER